MHHLNSEANVVSFQSRQNSESRIRKVFDVFPLEAVATTTARSRKARRSHFYGHQDKVTKEELDYNVKAITLKA